MSTKHTPGPLQVSKTFFPLQHRIESNHAEVEGAWKDIYVEFSGFFGSYGPQMFAAAPELLAALRALVLHDENERAAGTHGYSDNSPVAKRWNRARAAIALATLNADPLDDAIDDAGGRTWV